MMEQERLLTNPFPGLRPFEMDEYHLFFGRDGQSDEVLTKLRTSRFVAVVGTSGSGKSSLVRAGLLPALLSGHMTSAGSSWRVAIFRPGNNPIGSLAKALSDPNVLGAKDKEDASIRLANIERTLRRSSLGLLEVITQARMEPHENLLILADQFEELFRFRKNSTDEHPEDEAAAFVKLLLETKQSDKPADKKLPIYVILTMRSDYLGDCAHFWGLPEAINQGQYLIPRMTDDDRREAITGPIIINGGKITAPLVNRLLNDAGDDPAQLPILQHALMRTWDYWKQRGKETEPIDIPHYDNEKVGGMAKALSNHADEAFLELTPELQKVAEKLFKCLTEKEADHREGRRPATVEEICAITEADEEQVKAVIESFRAEDRSFLMPPPSVPLTASTLIDISHESLIRGWQRLRKWVDEEAQSARQYTRLADTAARFPKEEGYLRDPALQIGLNWLENNRPTRAWALRYHSGYDKTIEYLQASEKHREDEIADRERTQKEEAEREIKHAQTLATEQRRRVKLRNWMLLGLFMLMLMFAGSTAFAVQQWRLVEKTLREVEQERDRANQQTAEALEAKREANHQRDIATEALGTARLERDKAQKAEKETALERNAAERERKEAEKQRDAAQRAEREADRQRDIAKGALEEAKTQRDRALKEQDKAEQQRDTATRLLETVNEMDRSAPYFKAIMRGHDAEIRSVDLSPDEKLLVTASKDNTAQLWEAATGKFQMAYVHDGPIANAAFSHNGNLVATASEDGRLGIWDVKTSANLRMIGESGKRVSVVFSPDDKIVASILLTAHSTSTTRPADDRSQVDGKANAIPASVVELQSVSGNSSITLTGHNGVINSLAFSPDGKSLVTASADNTARVWETASGREILSLRGHLNEVNNAKFSPDGRFVVTASEDGTARVWDPLTGETLTRLPGHSGGVNSASFSPNGKYIVSISKERAYLWEAESPDTWKAVTKDSPTFLEGHSDEITDAVFSPDSELIATIGQDRTAQLWRAATLPNVRRDTETLPATATSLAVFRGHIKPLTSVEFSKDSKSLVTGSEDRTARVWDLSGIGRFSVAGVELTAQPSDYEGKCPVTVKFTGIISVTGSSGTVKYRFVRSDGTQSLDQELRFDAPGSKEVSEVREVFGGKVSRSGRPLPTTGSVEIEILGPVAMKSNQAAFTVRCQDSGTQQTALGELTAAQLKQIMPDSTGEHRELYLPHLQKAMEEFGINTPLRRAAFLAAVAHNTTELSILEEEDSDEFFETRYGGRKDLGNYQQGDGARYKGRGAFMITGRSNYQAYGEPLDVDLVAHPEQAATPELAFRTAALLWQRNGLNELADKSDIAAIVRRVSVGSTDLEKWKAYFEQAKIALGVTGAQ